GVIISDSNVMRLWSEKLRSCFRRLKIIGELALPGGEKNKNLTEIEKIYRFLLEAGADRRVCIIACGGGVVGDMAGLAAATFMRGLPLINLPTSLLAMVDSSIGGKNGVDFMGAKNMIGSFYKPELIAADVRFLETLPPEEIRNGLAELTKTVFLKPEVFVRFREEALKGERLSKDLARLHPYIREAALAKLEITERDPYDRGERFRLNWGHTFGHAVESASGYAVSHGQGVAIGIIASFILADKLHILKDPLLFCMKRIFNSLGLPAALPEAVNIEKVMEYFSCDKKCENGRSVFILPEELGKLIRYSEVSADDLRWVLQALA
ncbi:3-dehydroquinate synthase, partial [bacterium]|nr:3-dehydroquinate synthase [bacterium]